MSTPNLTDQRESPFAQNSDSAERERLKRVRHAWSQAPNAQDKMVAWVGRLLGAVLVSLIIYMIALAVK